jgi:hypothetical protein
MSLNSIKLEPMDIALLFKNALVEINKDQQTLPQIKNEIDPAVTSFKYLGENKKKTLAIVRYPDVAYLPDKQLSFLTKLLAACNLNLGDVAILNFQQHSPADFDKIMSQFKPKVVLLFDTNPSDFGLPMNFPEFQVQGYKDAVFLSSPPLDTIEPDKVLKSKLWVCLKKIFTL